VEGKGSGKGRKEGKGKDRVKETGNREGEYWNRKGPICNITEK